MSGRPTFPCVVRPLYTSKPLQTLLELLLGKRPACLVPNLAVLGVVQRESGHGLVARGVKVHH